MSMSDSFPKPKKVKLVNFEADVEQLRLFRAKLKKHKIRMTDFFRVHIDRYLKEDS